MLWHKKALEKISPTIHIVRLQQNFHTLASYPTTWTGYEASSQTCLCSGVLHPPSFVSVSCSFISRPSHCIAHFPPFWFDHLLWGNQYLNYENIWKGYLICYFLFITGTVSDRGSSFNACPHYLTAGSITYKIEHSKPFELLTTANRENSKLYNT